MTPGSKCVEDDAATAQRTEGGLDDHIDPHPTSYDDCSISEDPEWPSEDHAPVSADWPNDPPTSTGWDDQPSLLGNGDQAGHGDSSWEQEGTPSWAMQYSNNTRPNEVDFECPPPPKWQSSRIGPGSKDWLHPLSFTKPAYTMSDEWYTDIIDLHVLPLTTRLHDEAWLEADLQDVRVDDEYLLGLLTRGKQIAQKCLWKHMDKHEPEVRERCFPGGWHQVKFERDVLRAILPGHLGYRANDPELAYDAALSVVRLRNAVCHWTAGSVPLGRHAARVIDQLLKDLQKFAISLYDEESALAARELRDEARRAVEDTVRELEAVEPLFDEYTFKYHHKEMFKQITIAREEGNLAEFRFPGVIFRAANVWSRRYLAAAQTIEDPINQTEDQPGDGQLRDQAKDDEADGETEEFMW